MGGPDGDPRRVQGVPRAQGQLAPVHRAGVGRLAADPHRHPLRLRGLPDRVDDLGDVSTPDDDLCTTTTYVPDHRVANLPATVETVSVHCGQDPEFPGTRSR
ncbi:hypothetical protein ACFQV2_20050 [Actinokineospora soli]|uniref:Uncharacterized protein n=1 Tax=Actinokineospora soli TaxID=1048753 RepID=A0ABW2TRQ6_9PSEU